MEYLRFYNCRTTVYFISSSVFVRKATVIRAAAGFVTIKFDTNNGNDGPSGIRVRESKVYHTEKEANDVVLVNKSRQQNSRKL